MAGTSPLGGYLVAQTATFSVTAAQAETANGVLGTIYVPNNAIIHDVILDVVAVIDSGAGSTLDVGDASGPTTPDDDRFIAAFSGQAADSIRATEASGTLVDTVYQYVQAAATKQNEQAIQITNKVVAATGAAGTLRLTVIYHTP